MLELVTRPLPGRIGGHPINPSWRLMAELEVVLLSGTDDEQLVRDVDSVLRRFFPGRDLRTAGEYNAAYDGMLWFYRCGKAPAQSGGGSRSTERPYDFDVDMDLLIAAFQQTYGLDLTAQDLHWWRFRALFRGLPDGTVLRQIMDYRVADTGELKGAARARMEALKAKYALKGGVQYATSVEDRERALVARLQHRTP